MKILMWHMMHKRWVEQGFTFHVMGFLGTILFSENLISSIKEP